MKWSYSNDTLVMISKSESKDLNSSKSLIQRQLFATLTDLYSKGDLEKFKENI